MPSYTLTLQPDDTDGIDSYILGLLPTNNYATSAAIGIMRYDATNLQRAVLKFSGISAIPSGSIINSATLYITPATDYANQSGTISVYRLLRNWVEAEVTWNIYSTGNNWGTAGATNATDIDTTFGAWGTLTTTNAETVNVAKSISLNVAEFTKLITGEYNNYGWLLKTGEAIDRDGYNWHSSSATTASYRPKLVVEYYMGFHGATRGRHRFCSNVDPRIT